MMAKHKPAPKEPEEEVAPVEAPPRGAHARVVRLTRNGFLATAETIQPHGLVSRQRVHIRGAEQAEYNLEFTEITSVPTPESFTFETAGSPRSPASGDIHVWVPV